jgi:Fe-S cluster assembly ATPase SufC
MIDFFKKIKSNKNTLIFITHNFLLADKIWVDEVYVMEDWKIKFKWDKKLIDKIKKTWFIWTK